jgi:hypothetical protein
LRGRIFVGWGVVFEGEGFLDDGWVEAQGRGGGGAPAGRVRVAGDGEGSGCGEVAEGLGDGVY